MVMGMRIEKRSDADYLIGAPVECDGCDEVSEDGEVCCHHLNGEHLAVSHPRSDGACEILARWPIDPATATTAPRILTPAEARAAQAPYVAKEIERINEGLAMGMRSFAVNAPLFEDVKRALTTAGWVALNDGEAHGRVSFAVRERAEGERCKSAR
jgi:hypothetical protein